LKIIKVNSNLDPIQFQALSEFSLMSSTDLQGNIISINDNACRVSGYSRDELIGKNHSVLKSGHHAPEFYREIWQVITKGNIWRGVICNRKKNGDLYWVDSSIFPIQKDGAIVGYQSIRYDVTDRFLAQFSKEQAMQMSGLLSEYLSDGLVIQSSKSNILFSNKEACKILGLTEDQLLGKTSFDPTWKIFHADGTPMKGEEHPSELALRTGEPQKNKVMIVQKGDGTRVWISVNAAKILDNRIEGGYGTVAVFSDITTKIEKRKKEMETQRLAVIGEIAGSIAHDIRNPLTIIQSLLEVQQSFLKPEMIPSETVRAKLSNSASKMQNAVSRILSIVKVIQSNIRDASESKVESIKLEPLLQQIQLFLTKKLEAEGVQLNLEKLPKDFEFRGSSIKVTQILTNLISNALDAVSSLPQKWVQISAFKNEEFVEIRVIDSGSGISREIADKIFLPLFTTKSGDSGTGLGLSIVKRFMEEQGGSVELDQSFPNTCFVLKFPL
jgi:PAS domain S-box-containing protein